MRKCFGILFLIGIVFAITSYSQNATNKRGLDQFDLSNGVRVDKPQGKGADTQGRFTEFKTPPREPERVDESTYEGVKRMVQEAFSIEEGYRSSIARDGGPSLRPTAESVLARKLPSLNRVIEIYRVGLLDQHPLQDRRNVDLLTENQKVISEIMRAADAIRGEQFDCEVSGIKPLCSLYYRGYVPNGGPFEKTVLISGMLTALNRNFKELQGNLAVIE